MIGIVAYVFLLLVFLGVPIYYVLGIASAIYFLGEGISPMVVMQRSFVGLDQFVIQAVPLFILCGNLMSAGGTMTRLVEFSRALVGRFRGGLAHVNIVGSMFFAGISGAATADVAALGPLEIRMMTEGGYKKDFATALTVSSSIIGPIIPPSLPLVVYGVVASVSIGGMFLAGIIPGIFIGFSQMALVWFLAKKYKFPVDSKPTLKEFVIKSFRAIGPMGLGLIIIVGIYTGIFTPTEAAAVAVVYSFILGKFVYKELKWKAMPGIIFESARTAAITLSIVGIAGAFGYIMAIEQVPKLFGDWMLSVTNNKILLMLMINFGMLILGCFMETLASLIILTPIFLPIMSALGMDPITLGVIMSLNLTMGLLTPPLGINLFIASTITGLKIEEIVKANMPFFLLLIVDVLIISFVPQLTMWLPKLLMPGL